MAEEKKDAWLTYLALTTVILAVCATLSAARGASFSTKSVMFQAQATNQWAYYQAKSLKGYLYEIQREALELEQQKPDSGMTVVKEDKDKPSYPELRQRKILEYEEKISKYDEEKQQIQQEGKRLESLRDDAQRHSQIFSMAIVFLQIAILLSSVAALMKKRQLWYLGMAVGLIGMFYFADGFLLFF